MVNKMLGNFFYKLTFIIFIFMMINIFNIRIWLYMGFKPKINDKLVSNIVTA